MYTTDMNEQYSLHRFSEAPVRYEAGVALVLTPDITLTTYGTSLSCVCLGQKEGGKRGVEVRVSKKKKKRFLS